jgi:superfamily II RNA helicase
MKLKEELAGPFRQLQETARRIAQVSQECKISINVDEYVQKFSPHMMDVVYSWCKVIIKIENTEKLIVLLGSKVFRNMSLNRYF